MPDFSIDGDFSFTDWTIVYDCNLVLASTRTASRILSRFWSQVYAPMPQLLGLDSYVVPSVGEDWGDQRSHPSPK